MFLGELRKALCRHCMRMDFIMVHCRSLRHCPAARDSTIVDVIK
jgi:hypothetical protein